LFLQNQALFLQNYLFFLTFSTTTVKDHIILRRSCFSFFNLFISNIADLEYHQEFESLYIVSFFNQV